MSEYDVEVTDIEGIDGWKNEVKRLLEQVGDLRQENSASQLIAAFALRQSGPVVLSREEIANGLPGHGIQIDESDDGNVVLSVRTPDAEQ